MIIELSLFVEVILIESKLALNAYFNLKSSALEIIEIIN